MDVNVVLDIRFRNNTVYFDWNTCNDLETNATNNALIYSRNLQKAQDYQLQLQMSVLDYVIHDVF